MTRDDLKEFVNAGGVEKIGHASYALLSFIIQQAESQGYPKSVEVSVSESMYKANIGSIQRLCQIRQKLVEESCIESYESNGRTGYYYLTYN